VGSVSDFEAEQIHVRLRDYRLEKCRMASPLKSIHRKLVCHNRKQIIISSHFQPHDKYVKPKDLHQIDVLYLKVLQGSLLDTRLEPRLLGESLSCSLRRRMALAAV
jgi:hypothetical protein